MVLFPVKGPPIMISPYSGPSPPAISITCPTLSPRGTSLNICRDDLVTFVSERGYSGIEAMAGIPGTVGAAPVQNIGAYGQEVTQVIISVEAYDTNWKNLWSYQQAI